ncbi:MAG: hypothetical protein D6721_08405 [Gammaproteobacteria bacterium]|nr:MAG: hypothetical protein D6721_08405 [Gammaproteobacteria bacterium]
MYESYYGFREKPFSLLPDPGFLYFTKKHRLALAMLEYGLANQAGFTVISGEIGTGKTTLIRHLLDRLDQELAIGLITNTHQGIGELMQWVLLAFGLDYKDKSPVEMYQALTDYVIEQYAQGRRTVLIVDEAQNLAVETLEELRMLSNINADKDQVLQIILVGQPELREKLRRPELVQFAQRITVDYHLTALDEHETRELIRHRLQVAGGAPDLFTDAACSAVHRYSGGVPRLINLLCDLALVYGFADQCERIDADLVTEVAREKQAGGLFPAAPAATPPPATHADATPPASGGGPAAEVPDGAPGAHERPGPHRRLEVPLRVALAGDEPALRRHLRTLLEAAGASVVQETSLDGLDAQPPQAADLLLVDVQDEGDAVPDRVLDLMGSGEIPVLFNDSAQTRESLQGRRPDFADQLVRKLSSLLPEIRARRPDRHTAEG